MTKEKILEMRLAIDLMESALMGTEEIIDLPERWGEPRLGDHVMTAIRLPASKVYRICDALRELNRIINSEEYVP